MDGIKCSLFESSNCDYSLTLMIKTFDLKVISNSLINSNRKFRMNKLKD